MWASKSLRAIACWVGLLAFIAATLLFLQYRPYAAQKYQGVDILTVLHTEYTGDSAGNSALRNMTKVYSEIGTALVLCGNELSQLRRGTTYRVETRIHEFVEDNQYKACQQLLSVEPIQTRFQRLDLHSGALGRVELPSRWIDGAPGYGLDVELKTDTGRTEIPICNDLVREQLEKLRGTRVDLILDRAAYSTVHDCYPLVAYRRHGDPRRFVPSSALVLSSRFSATANGMKAARGEIEAALELVLSPSEEIKLPSTAAENSTARSEAKSRTDCAEQGLAWLQKGQPEPAAYVQFIADSEPFTVYHFYCEAGLSRFIYVVSPKGQGFQDVCRLDVPEEPDFTVVQDSKIQYLEIDSSYRAISIKRRIWRDSQRIRAEVTYEGEPSEEEALHCIRIGRSANSQDSVNQ